MTKSTNARSNDAAFIEFCKLSKGVDTILDRWPNSDRPTKLTLLNDLAAAIKPGANWGALKATANQVPAIKRESYSGLIPPMPQSSNVLPARLCELTSNERSVTAFELAEDLQPLFALEHRGNPIVGLALSVSDGNGFCEASIYGQLIVNRAGAIHSEQVHAHDLSPEVARLVYCAIQNLEAMELYPIFAQLDCGRMHTLLGEFPFIAALPETYGRSASPELPSQGLRLLFDETYVPSSSEIDFALRLASATLPYLDLKQFPSEPASFALSEPLHHVWKPVDFDLPPHLDERPMFRKPDTNEWFHDDDYLYDTGIQTSLTLGEPLDLALALINIDDPNVYLKASLIPGPKNPRGSYGLKQGRRGGLHRQWQVLRLRAGKTAEVLSLDESTRKRLELGLNGWAIHEGYSVSDNVSQVKAEALIARSTRRASHHMGQVRAIMDGVEPADV